MEGKKKEREEGRHNLTRGRMYGWEFRKMGSAGIEYVSG